MDFTVIALGLVLSGLIGAAIGQTKNRPIDGFVLGLVAGPIGWLLVGIGKAKE